MSLKSYSIFSKAPELKPHHNMAANISKTLVWWVESYLTVNTQSAYFTAPI